jgi:hypothetical protein
MSTQMMIDTPALRDTQKQVLVALQTARVFGRDGLTDEEIATFIHQASTDGKARYQTTSSVMRRRLELVTLGLVESAGTRKRQQGRALQIWRVKEL